MRAKRILFVIVIIFGLVSPISAQADAILTVTPLTWNVIGLDSNSPASGPNRFPVGVRICNTGTTAEDVVVTFAWDDGKDLYAGDPDADPYINLRPGSLSSITIPSILAGTCSDVYFEAEVTKVSDAFEKTRRYHITATDSDGATGTSPRPRELYVEHLISQNRNGITSIKLNGTAIPAGGSMTLMVGNTYTIELAGFTATQGYNQLESFINFPNTIFQIQSVSTTYSANTAPHIPSPDDKLYADACLWENDPNSPNYLSCIGCDCKAGGDVRVTYTVKIISGAGTNQTLNTLIYDFSGSSFHYNADYGVGYRIAEIVSPASVTISKTFNPKAISPGDTSTMTFKLSNPTTETITGVNFTDTFPTDLKVADPPDVTYSGCSAGAFSPVPQKDDASLAFSNGTLSPNSVCTITVDVTAPEGTYLNTTGHLFINIDEDTGNFASDTLTASTASACIPGQTLANWTVPVGTTANPPDTTGGVPTIKASDVSTAIASAFIPEKTAIVTTGGSNDTTAWSTWGYSGSGQYVDFVVDTSKYSDVSMSFYVKNDGIPPGPTSLVISYNSGSGFTNVLTISNPANTFTLHTIDFTGLTNTGGNTTFRFTATGANNNNQGAGLVYDNVKFTGCRIPAPAPTITKSFSPDPIVKGATSTLTFTISNTATGSTNLSGIAFTDVLPAGLSVADSTSTQCGGTLTTTASTRTIELTGGSLAAGGSCSFDVAVTGTTEGEYDNVTGYISSTESGTSTNYATDSLTVIAPPTIAKSFSPTSLLTGGTSTLTFTITNPNQLTTLTGISFTDTLPSGLTVGTSGSTATCDGSLTTTSPSSISFTGGSLAPNTTCTFSVTVTGTTAGSKANTTSEVTSTEGGNGNTASATLVVSDPVALIGLNKQISTDNINWYKFVGVPVGGVVYYRFTVSNEGEAPLSSVNVTDTNVDMTTCTLPTSLAIDDSASCTVGPITAVAGLQENTSTATGTYSTQTPSATSTAEYGATGLTIAKNVTETHFTAAGDVLHYSYVVTNSGSAPLLGLVTVADDKSSDETCPAVSTVGDFDNYLDPGENITCTATYTVQAVDFAAGSVTNEASATAGGVTSNTDSKTVTVPVADLSITKTDGSETAVPGQGVTYTIVVTNNGPSDVIGATVVDNFPAALTGVGYTSVTTGTVSGNTASGSGNISDTVNMAVGSTITYTVTGTVSASATGSLENTATVSVPAGVTDPTPGNNSATDTDTLTPPNLFDPPIGFKTVNDSGYPELEWRMVWINNSNATAILARVTDPIPIDTTYVPGSLQCMANGGSSTSTCMFDQANYLIVWEGNISPDPGATNENNAANEVIISYSTTMSREITRVVNQGCANWDENGNGSIVDDVANSQTPACSDDPLTSPSGDPTVWTKSVAIPTMTGWGVIIFAILAGFGSVYYLRRQRRVEGSPGL